MGYPIIYPVVEQVKIDTFQNLLVAFQLYVACILVMGASFVVEFVPMALSKVNFCNRNYVMPSSESIIF